MAKRKPTDMAQMNLRLPEKLRRMIEVEAKKNGHSLNRELVRRLEQSFAQQATVDLINSAAQTTGIEVSKLLLADLKSGIQNWLLVEMKIQKPVMTSEAKEEVKEPVDEE